VAAQGVQLLATLLAAALLVTWGREAWPAWRPAGWLAAAVFLGNPVVVYLAGTGYIEPGLTLFVAASLYALDRWRGTGAKGWLALAALFGATAADVKYLGLFFLGIAGLIVLLADGRSRPAAARFREILLFAAVAAAFLAPWYLRIYLYTGNPLFPYLPQVFGNSAWDPETAPGESLPHRLERWARLPWDVVFERDRYNQEPPLSPVYLAALPLLALGALRDSRVRRPLGIAALYSLVFLWLPRDSRYLVPVLPLASLAVAGSLAAAVRRWPRLASRRLAAALCLGAFLPGWLYAGYRIERQGPPPVTAGERDAYLGRRLPLYPAIAWLNRTRGSGYTLWALHAENMTYFAAGRFLGDWHGPASFGRVLAAARDAQSFHGALRRLGATHLLIPRRDAYGQVVAPPVPEDAVFRRWFELVHHDRSARLYALRPVAPGPRM
jgi:4-amino-4-deoxy-L-arabinose transferase-like glycosyltransferase